MIKLIKLYMTKQKSVFQDKKVISYVFLGVGFSLFLLNISGLLSFMPGKYNVSAFDISVLSSMIIIIYSTYVIHNEK